MKSWLLDTTVNLSIDHTCVQSGSGPSWVCTEAISLKFAQDLTNEQFASCEALLLLRHVHAKCQAPQATKPG